MARVKRRVFLKVAGGVTAASIILPGCLPQRTWNVPSEQPDGQVPGKAYWFATTCAETPGGPGIVVRNLDGRVRKVEGNPLHPVSRGKSMPATQASVQRLYNPDRIKAPLRLTGAKGSGQYQEIGWNEALQLLTERVRGAGTNVAFLTGALRGHMRFLVERFMNGLGAQPPVVFDLYQTVEGRDALRAANQAAFGRAEIPDYDLDNCDFLVTFGADLFGTWLSPTRFNWGYGQMRQGRGTRGYMVAFEPRMTQAGAVADEWIPIRPGTEGLVALALAGVVAGARGGSAPGGVTVEEAARQADVPGGAETLNRIGRLLAASPAGLAVGGGVPAGQTNGTWNLWAINALNGVLGAVGRPGGVRFGPPSPFPDIPVAGPGSPVGALRDLIGRMQGGQVQVLMVYETNPVYGLPPGLQFQPALDRVPFVVSFASFMDETAARADLILPDHTPLEQWGDDIPEPTVGYAVASLRQPAVMPFVNTRQTADVLLQLTQALSTPGLLSQLPYPTFNDLLRARWATLASLNRGSVRNAANPEAFFEQALRQGGWWDPGTTGMPVSGAGTPPPAPEPAQFDGSPNDFPYFFVPFLSPAWGDGRGANLPHLQEMPDPMTSCCWGTWVELNPQTAAQLGVRDNEIVEVSSAHGSVRAPVVIYPAIRPDVIAIPFGQGHTAYGQYAAGRGVNPVALLAPAVEARSGQLAWASTRVRVRPTGEIGRIVRYIRTLDGQRQLEGFPLIKTVAIEGRQA